MSDIPEDVRRVAWNTLVAALDSDMPDSSDIIARAIMAERERAAQIAETMRTNPRYTDWPYATACADIAAAIRNAQP